uniref:USC2-6p n=1 Tax=Myxococcus xanthus TaxID=34 RepID=Q93SK3_MYXXA|nr:USC2-6p [Myxococcus xanthus]
MRYSMRSGPMRAAIRSSRRRRSRRCVPASRGKCHAVQDRHQRRRRCAVGAANALCARNLQQPLSTGGHRAMVGLAAAVPVHAAAGAGRLRGGRGRAGWPARFRRVRCRCQ